MRIKNKEIRARRHRKEQKIKDAARELRVQYGDGKSTAEKPVAPKKAPAAPKAAPKKAAAEGAAKPAAKKAAPKPKKAEAPSE